MKSVAIYLICALLIFILAVLYMIKLYSIGINLGTGIFMFCIFMATAVAGFLIFKLLSKKITKKLKE